MDIRESRALPEGLDEPALEPFLATLVARLAPGLENSEAYLPFAHEAEPGANFSAGAHLEDGTLIVVAAQPSERSLTLVVTDAPPHLKSALIFMGRWTYLAFAGVITVGFAAGTWVDSALWGTLASLAVLIGWVVLEFGRQARKQRAARVRPLDVESWRARFDAALAAAREEVLR